HRAELLNRRLLDELAAHRPLKVGRHGLEGLLADFREVPPFVDHAAELAPHADRTGLAGVLRGRRPPEGAKTDPPGQPQAVENRLPATARFGRSNHERIPWGEWSA